jgi:hypothetical protein
MKKKISFFYFLDILNKHFGHASGIGYQGQGLSENSPMGGSTGK